MMLFVWLLALGAGIANACLVQEDHARHGHRSHRDSGFTSVIVTELDALTIDHASEEAHLGAGDHEISLVKLACQNFCTAERTGVVKQQTYEPANLDVALVLTSMWWVASPSADRASQLPALGDPAWSEPPVSIRFLRLTI